MHKKLFMNTADTDSLLHMPLLDLSLCQILPQNSQPVQLVAHQT